MGAFSPLAGWQHRKHVVRLADYSSSDIVWCHNKMQLGTYCFQTHNMQLSIVSLHRAAIPVGAISSATV